MESADQRSCAGEENEQDFHGKEGKEEGWKKKKEQEEEEEEVERGRNS